MADTHALHRTSDPKTSREAAEKIAPKAPTIRRKVEAFALDSSEGFIDEELSAHFGDTGSSYRSRREELAQQNIILASGYFRPNSRGLNCIVWVHRDHYRGVAPPIIPRQKAQSATDKAAAREREAICAFLESPEGRRLNRQYTILAIQRGEHLKAIS